MNAGMCVERSPRREIAGRHEGRESEIERILCAVGILKEVFLILVMVDTSQEMELGGVVRGDGLWKREAGRLDKRKEG